MRCFESNGTRSIFLVVHLDGRQEANRKPEPIAVPIYGDTRMYLEMQPRTREYVFARGSKPIRTSA